MTSLPRRGAIGIDRIGHTGTLDPLATGVLPLVVGRATRLASFLSGAEKEYVARIRFGTSTATYDAEGETLGPAYSMEALELAPLPGPVAEAAVRDVLPDFAGTYWQLPPPFSAKKIGGTPAYKLARLRKPVELKPVQVTVKAIELRTFADNLAEIWIVGSSGFYVRSLAHELGQRLECGAYLEGLQRTRAGSFGVADATPLDVLIGEGRAAIERLIPVDRLLPELPAITLSEQGVKRASHGNSLGVHDLLDARKATEWLADGRSGGRLRLVDAAGALLGIAEPLDGGLLHPVIVLV